MIKYLGSKRALLALVTSAVQSVPDATSVIDLFSGTSRVGHALKKLGFRVIANDCNAYARTLAECYVAVDREKIIRDAETLVREFNRMPGEEGYFTDTFCEESQFFQPKNGRRVDAIRSAIEEKDLEPELRSVMLVSLMEAADRVDSTCGVQMAYLKEWAQRSYNDLDLRVPDCLPRAIHGKGEAHQLDAADAVRLLRADVAYIDPPYNQHSYLGNYHIWETLVLWDRPNVYGRACKRVDCQERKSPFNSKKKFRAALEDVVYNVQARVIIVSFNNEGYISRGELESILSERGQVMTTAHPHKRYVGAQIGIYNPSGVKVGSVSHLQNVEYLYVVDTTAKANVKASRYASGSRVSLRP
jgi:adenine-specific DNA-methyltransferase